MSKGVVSKYVQLAQAKGLGWPLPPGVDPATLEVLLFPAREKATRFAEPDYFAIHQELKRKGVTLQLLWAEHVELYGDRARRYSQFCARYRAWRDRQRRSMRQTHRAGEKLFIDFAGPTLEVIDRATGEVQRAHVFVAVLGASSYTYAEATRGQGLPEFLAAHQRAFRFFGGVPHLLVPDNLKAAVDHADRYTPTINRSYGDLAAHYDTAVLPARPRKSKDKAKAEVAVQLVERWIMARLRHRTFFSFAALNDAIAQLLETLNRRPFQGRNESRRDLFEALDQPALEALPAVPYEHADWLAARPGIDYHVQVDGRFYSVPHALVGQRLDVRLTASIVEVLHKGRRVALHARDHGETRYLTQTEHMPQAHQAHREWSPGRFLHWARDIGPSTRAVIAHQLVDRPHPEHGYRACLGILHLARRYGPKRLENACARAVALGTRRYRSIASILQQGLDGQPLSEPETPELPLHGNVRGPDYYH